MIPWRRIRIRDLDHLEQHAGKFDPYCHLNVIDLWSYRAGVNHWFQLHDTIVYRLNDYMDDSLYTTILGDKSVKEAVKVLCRKSKKQDDITLKCLPESTFETIKGWGAVLEYHEDHDNHDYIYKLTTLINFSSDHLRHQHKKYRKLLRRYPQLHYEILDITTPAHRRRVYNMFRRWKVQTSADDWRKEFTALRRAMNIKKSGLVCVGFFDGKKMIGYTINRPEGGGYYQAYFGKADRKYSGLTLYQEHETAVYMSETYGCEYMNLQPDSGIEGLRAYKTSLGPIRKLKKYTVRIDVKRALV